MSGGAQRRDPYSDDRHSQASLEATTALQAAAGGCPGQPVNWELAA
ncbi:hypothetical protein [Streptomyces sp. NPDC048187]